jgi:acyl carrier protein
VDGYVAPVRGLEEAIAGIWAEVLGAPQVGARDHFFDLGGHSLLLVRVQTLIRQRLGLDVALLDLFTHATVARLAAHLGRPVEDADPVQPPESPVDLARDRERRGREALALRRARRGGATTTDVGTPR